MYFIIGAQIDGKDSRMVDPNGKDVMFNSLEEAVKFVEENGIQYNPSKMSFPEIWEMAGSFLINRYKLDGTKIEDQ